MPKKKKPRREDLAPGEMLCSYCTAKCCRYFSLQLDTPTTWDEFDNLRWYLAHDRTAVFVEKGGWYLLIDTKCQYLMPDGLCGIYQRRMKICRSYSTANCEYDDDATYEKYFDHPDQIWEYAEAVLPPRRRTARAISNELPILSSASAPPPALVKS